MEFKVTAVFDKRYVGSVCVEHWTYENKNDTVYVSVGVPRASAFVYITKAQARELGEALIKIAEEE